MKQVNTHAGFVLREFVRCPDCDIREDLKADGTRQPQRHARIKRCSSCEGKAELKLYGVKRVDPYAKREISPSAIRYANKRAVSAWTRRNQFRNDPPEWLVNLQEEPTYGHNHGRERSEEGWHVLETNDIPSFKHYVSARLRLRQRAHGTHWRYRDGCRCKLCKRFQADYRRLYRQAGNVRTLLGEEVHLSAPSEKPNGTPATQRDKSGGTAARFTKDTSPPTYEKDV